MKQSIAHVSLVVRDYDEAIEFFTTKLKFKVIEDIYQPAQDKRWVVVFVTQVVCERPVKAGRFFWRK